MKKSTLSLLFFFILNLSFGQCFFGFEHINTAQNDSALVIHKYGFPSFTDFALYQDNNNGWIIDTTLSNQTSDTLIFGTHVDTLGTFALYGTSLAGDTLGYAGCLHHVSSCYPQLFIIEEYVAPSSISASDGSMIIRRINSSISFMASDGFIQENTDSIMISSLSEGIKVGDYVLDGQTAEDSMHLKFIIGDPSNWANIQNGTMTCPIGIDLATDQSTCDGVAYVGQVQNGVAPYNYDWNGTGVFVTDTSAANLCVGNNYVIIEDANGDAKVCGFAMGSLDNGYFPPTQISDTTIHTYTDYCISPSIDSISVIGSAIIDTVSASVVWSFYDAGVLIDQILDTFQFTIPNGSYGNIQLYTHLVCNGDTLKSSSSVYSTYGYISLPFTETGFLNVQELNTNNEISVYPNPLQSIVNIVVNLHDVQTITVFDGLGKRVEVKVNKHDNSRFTLDFSGLSEGYYIIRILTKEGESHIKKVFKN